MHDIKIIRKNPNYFKKKISERNTEIDINELLDLDKKNRELIHEKEKFEQEKKTISQKKDKSKFSKSKELTSKIEETFEITSSSVISLIIYHTNNSINCFSTLKLNISNSSLQVCK